MQPGFSPFQMPSHWEQNAQREWGYFNNIPNLSTKKSTADQKPLSGNTRLQAGQLNAVTERYWQAQVFTGKGTHELGRPTAPLSSWNSSNNKKKKVKKYPTPIKIRGWHHWRRAQNQPYSLLSRSTSVFFSRLPVSRSLLLITGALCSGGWRGLCSAPDVRGGGTGAAAPPDAGSLVWSYLQQKQTK